MAEPTKSMPRQPALATADNIGASAKTTQVAGQSTGKALGRISPPTSRSSSIRRLRLWRFIATNLAVIGRSLVPVDPFLPASIDEFRIYSGALSPAEIALTHINGPNSTTRDPGQLNSIKVVTNAYPAYSGIVPPVIRANYANLPNFNLIPNNSAAPNGLEIGRAHV